MSRRHDTGSSPRRPLDEDALPDPAGAVVEAGAGAPGAANALSRRELLGRTGRMGFSALGLYAVMSICGGGGGALVAPTATPSSGTVTLGSVRVRWFLTGTAAQGATAAQMAALAQGYGNHILAITAGEQQHLSSNLQSVGQVGNTFGTPLQTALPQAGVNLDQLQSDLNAFAQITDPAQRAAAQHDLDAKYMDRLVSAYRLAGIDQVTTMTTLAAQVVPLVTNPNTITFQSSRLLAFGWVFKPFAVPPPCSGIQTFNPPYTLQAAMGLDRSDEEANAQTGHLDVNDSLVAAGSSQHLASIGVNVSIPPAVTHLRVEADVDIGLCYVHAQAEFGGAVGELTLRLKLLDGIKLLAEQRLSLAKSVGVFLSWEEEYFGPASLTLSLDMTLRKAVTVKTYSVVVELVGTGICGAGDTHADGSATVKEIRVATAC